jgi:hypothetical protein
MKKIYLAAALASAMPSAALAQVYQTTGGYGSAVLDQRGAAFVNTDGLKATYSYNAIDVTPVATATDVLVITGSATKTVRISQVCAGGTATAASIYDLYLYKRTTADTGGTSTAPVPAQHDSNDPAATATIALYTANPSALGTSGTPIRAGHFTLINATTPSAGQNFSCWIFGEGEEKVVLRGTSQQLAINHAGGAVPAGANLYYMIEFQEE